MSVLTYAPNSFDASSCPFDERLHFAHFGCLINIRGTLNGDLNDFR